MFCWQLVRFKCLAGSTFGVIIDFWPQGDRKRPPKQMYWVFVAKQFLYLDNKQTRSNTSVPTDRVSFHLLNVSVIITGVDIAAVCIFHIMLGKHLRCEQKKKISDSTRADKSCKKLQPGVDSSTASIISGSRFYFGVTATSFIKKTRLWFVSAAQKFRLPVITVGWWTRENCRFNSRNYHIRSGSQRSVMFALIHLCWY